MTVELEEFFRDQNLSKLRVRRPSRFVFLCGGEISKIANGKAKNLRDYICRVRPLKRSYHIVLAETAIQLYRDTNYHDLISFEEDIARIAAIVVVISESAGSLAELGAFASNETISPALRIIIAQEHAAAESFVRYGPVEKILKRKRENVGVYPWTTHKKGALNVSSSKSHYGGIKSFIANHVLAVPNSTTFSNLDDKKIFFVIYWIIQLSIAISPSILYGYVRSIFGEISDSTIKDKIYCMKIAGWVNRLEYSGKDYYFALFDEDPFDYEFNAGVINKHKVQRKFAVTQSLQKKEKPPKYVLKKAIEARKNSI